MKFNINNPVIFKQSHNAILKFEIEYKSDNTENLILYNSIPEINSSENINFYIQNNYTFENFKHEIKSAPVTIGSISMFDYNGNNIGKYQTLRGDNNNGGNINFIDFDNQYLNNINISDKQNVILMNNYYPINNIGNQDLIKKFFDVDYNKIQKDKFSKTVLFINKVLYEKMESVIDVNKFNDIFMKVCVVENVVNDSIELLFGRVIKGKVQPISKLLTIKGGEISKVNDYHENCIINHRTNNRIQFISQSKDSYAVVMLILDNVKENVYINFDSTEIIFKSMTIDDTPHIDVDIYINLFKVYNLVKNMDKNNPHDFFLSNSREIMEQMIYCYDSDVSYGELNQTEKILLGYFGKLMKILHDKFKSLIFKYDYNFTNSEKKYYSTLSRKTTC